MPKPQHQVQDHLGLGRLGAGLVAAGAAVVLPSDQPPMPPEQRVGAEDGAQLAQGITAQLHRGGIQAALLGQVQDDSSMAEFLPQNAVLFPEELDYLLLLAVHPPRQRHHEERPWF